MDGNVTTGGAGAVVSGVLVAMCVTSSVVVALVLPTESTETTAKKFVLDAVRSTETLQLPDTSAVVLAMLAPPVITTVVVASAVPETIIGLVVVECGDVGSVTTGAVGAAIAGVVHIVNARSDTAATPAASFINLELIMFIIFRIKVVTKPIMA